MEKKEWHTLLAWSLGAHLCLKNLHRIRARRLILMAPFLDFCAYTPRQRVLKMKAGLEKNPRALVRWFWRMSSTGPGDDRLIEETGLLRAGLDFLLESRVDLKGVHCRIPIILIHGVHDRIVPARASEKILEYLPHACYFPVPWGHYIPEDEIMKIGYEEKDKDQL